ncbi:S1C family serine protease [Pseudomonadota bacterium]
MRAPKSVSGSGFVFEKGLILTNAHVVSNSTFTQVRLYGQAKKHIAKVVAISHDADLAILTLKDQTVLQDIKPLTLGKLPQLQQEVLVYGYPKGGSTLSITKGVVSRIENQLYSHSYRELLSAQLDAAINAGNSGGPAVVDNEVVGVAMQSLKKSNDIGYMVPVPVINHFLTDIKDGKYDGFPRDGIIIQALENNSFRDKYQLHKEQSGVVISQIYPSSPAIGHLQVEDVILEIDNHIVANDGTIEFRTNERTLADYLVQMHQVGDEILLKILRNGHEKILSFRLDGAGTHKGLVEPPQFEVKPSYFIYGGLLFTPLSINLLKAWGDEWYDDAPTSLLSLSYYGIPKVKNEQAIILTNVLAAEINEGYEDLIYERFTEVNGERFANLKELVKMVEQSNDTYISFKTDNGAQIVLNKAEVEQKQQEILQTYQIPSDRFVPSM